MLALSYVTYEAFRYRWYSEKCQALMPQSRIPFTRRQQLNRWKMRKYEHKFADADMNRPIEGMFL